MHFCKLLFDILFNVIKGPDEKQLADLVNPCKRYSK